MNFEKTRSLSGYPLTIADNDFFYDSTIKNPFKFISFNGKLLKEIFSPLQATINIKVVPHKSFDINHDGTKVGSSMLKIFNGTFDTRAALQFQRVFGDFWKNELNIFIRSGICYALADRTTSWNEYFLQNYFLHTLVLLMYILLSFETIMTHFFKRIIDITMDLLRGLIGVSVLREPKTSFKRLIFLLIILPFIVISSFVQSKLTSFVTVMPMKELKIDKIEDLFDKNYEVFTTNDHRQYFISTPFYGQIRTPVDECLGSLKNNFSIACAHDCIYLKNIARLAENVKILPDKYLQRYWTSIFPVDYPILPRIRDIYYKLYESGIIVNILKQYEPIKIDRKAIYSDMTIDELRFVFYFLVCGYLYAIFVFFIEIGSSKIFKLLIRLRECSVRRYKIIRVKFAKIKQSLQSFFFP